MGDGSLGPSVWAVSDGRAGNAAQVRAVAQALGETRRWMRIAHIAGEGHRGAPITVSPRPPWTWMPASAWPLPRWSLPRGQRAALRAPWPTVWIGAGRRTAPLSAAVRRWSNGATYVVHILDPKLPPEAFDLLVTPQHDGLSGDNVVSTVGAPTYVSHDDQESAALTFADLADERGRSAIVILGGQSKAHTFSDEDASRLAGQLRQIAGLGWRLRITTSRRTPVDIVARFRALADEIGARFWAGPEDGANPYLAWLLFSDAAIVTEDSTNMLSDAAWHGLPIHIARLTGGSEKFDRLHKGLIGRKCARWFDGTLDSWAYEPLREADRVADRIVADLLARHPQPDFPSHELGKTAAPDWFGG